MDITKVSSYLFKKNIQVRPDPRFWNVLHFDLFPIYTVSQLPATCRVEEH